MSFKIKLKDLVNSVDPIKRVMSTAGIEVVASFQLSRIAKRLDHELTVFQEVQKQLFTELGEDFEGGNRRIQERHIPEFSKKMADLLETELEINANPVSIRDLGKNMNPTPSPADFVACDSFITE